MSQPQRILIVGSGLAGASAAGALREAGYTGQLSVFGQESHRPYELPPLSKGILLGDTDEPDWVHDEGFYAEHNIELNLSTQIRQLQLGNRLIVDDAGTEHGYDRLLLATGSSPRTLPVAGGALPGLHLLRTLDDSLALRAQFTEGKQVVIVGAGWIGCEVAAAAIKHGAQVTIVEPQPLPLYGVLGDTIGGVFRDLHAEHGVTWRLGTGVSEFTAGQDGRVDGVRLADGNEIGAQVVVVGVGAAPRVALAHKAGLTMADTGGVDTDSCLRTSAHDVFAAGDIAAHFHPTYHARVRVEHWANAKDQGAHVARNLLGESQPFANMPFFFSDQYDLGMEYRGLADPFVDELVVRGDLGAREFIAFWLRDGALAAAMNVNMWDDGDALQALVDKQARVDPQALRSADLASLV